MAYTEMNIVPIFSPCIPRYARVKKLVSDEISTITYLWHTLTVITTHSFIDLLQQYISRSGDMPSRPY